MLMPPAAMPGVVAGAAPPATMPPEVKDQLDQLKEDMTKMMSASEDAGAKGDVDGSQFKLMLVGEIKTKMKELEDKYPAGPAPRAPAGGAGGMGLPGMPAGITGAPLIPMQPRIISGVLPPGMSLETWQKLQALARTKLQADAYDVTQAQSAHIQPEVQELAHHFQLTEGHARMLNEQLKRRNNTYDEDIAAMYEILKGAKNPIDLLMVCVHWMREGVFNGVKTPNPNVEKAAAKFGLDPPSACKLAQVLETREDGEDCLRRVITHLERSNKPSAMVMKMLRGIKSGDCVDECSHAPSIGSYLHKEEHKATQREASRKSRSRVRAKSPAKQRERSRSRDKKKSRDRDRDKKSRDRDRDRDRDKKSRSRSRDKRSRSRRRR